jgi:hypothetical protein
MVSDKPSKSPPAQRRSQRFESTERSFNIPPSLIEEVRPSAERKVREDQEAHIEERSLADFFVLKTTTFVSGCS